MKKKIKRMVEQEVEVCDRCEQGDSLGQFALIKVVPGDDSIFVQEPIELCNSCRNLVASKFTIRRKAKREKSDDKG